MNLYELDGEERNPVYQQVAAANHARVHHFLSSMIQAAIDSQKPWLSESLIKAVNFHAIVGLHDQAGEYRSHGATVGPYSPPDHYRVKPLMEDLVNFVNWHWQSSVETKLAAYALWKVNHGRSTIFTPL